MEPEITREWIEANFKRTESTAIGKGAYAENNGIAIGNNTRSKGGIAIGHDLEVGESGIVMRNVVMNGNKIKLLELN